jgi:hypothetical protein
MLSMLFALLAPLPLPATAETIFTCSTGSKQIEITADDSQLHYRFGAPARPELAIDAAIGGPDVLYHRKLFARGEHQSLRFRKAGHDYIVRNEWAAPGADGAEHNVSSLIVQKDGKTLSTIPCRSGGDLREHAVFKRLRADPKAGA